MKKLKSKMLLSLLGATLLNGYEIDDPTLGNIAIEAGINPEGFNNKSEVAQAIVEAR